MRAHLLGLYASVPSTPSAIALKLPQQVLLEITASIRAYLNGDCISMPDEHDSTATAENCSGPELNTNESMNEKVIAPARDPLSPGRSASNDSERIADRVSWLLLTHRPALFCDDCIADRLGLSHRRQANRVTSAMASSSAFWRDIGSCSACSKHKQVIRHA